MNAVERVRALFVEGETVVCVRNTYIPAREGEAREVERVRKTVVDCLSGGKPYRMELPTRVKDVVSVDEQEATWMLQGPGGPERLKGHYVTVRKA